MLNPGILQQLWALAAVELCFCLAAVVDVFLRFVMLGRRSFGRSERWWSLLDAAAATCALWESAWLWEEAAAEDAPPIRAAGLVAFALRVARPLRAACNRSSPELTFWLREFRVLIGALSRALVLFAWIALGSAMLLLVVGTLLADGTLTYCASRGLMQDPSTEQLRAQFGGVGLSFSSLYDVVTGGVFWTELAETMAPLAFGYKLAFHLCVIFGSAVASALLVAMLASTFALSLRDRGPLTASLAQVAQSAGVEDAAGALEANLQRLDLAKVGAVRPSDIECWFEDEHLGVLLRTMELNASHLRTVMSILDVRQTGFVGIEDFSASCNYVAGAARAVDVVMLQYEVGVIGGMMRHLGELVEDRLDGVEC